MARQIAIHSRRGAYIALVFLTLMWGLNWMAMKYGLRYAQPAVYNVDRILVAIPVIAIVSSMLVFGERITATEWIGIASIGTGLVILSVRAWREVRRGRSDSIQVPAIETG